MNKAGNLERVSADTEAVLIGWLTGGSVMDWIAYQAVYLELGRITLDGNHLVIRSPAALEEMHRLAVNGPVAAAVK